MASTERTSLSVPVIGAIIGLSILLIAGALTLAPGTHKNTTTSATSATPRSTVVETAPVTVTGRGLPVTAEQPLGHKPGLRIPSVGGTNFSGEKVQLLAGNHRAKVVLFVSHWCDECRRELPALARYLGAHPLPAGTDVIAVSTGVDKSKVNYPPSTWFAKAGWTAPVLVDSADGATMRLLGAASVPAYLVTDTSGQVITRGYGSLTTAQLAQLIRAAGVTVKP